MCKTVQEQVSKDTLNEIVGFNGITELGDTSVKFDRRNFFVIVSDELDNRPRRTIFGINGSGVVLLAQSELPRVPEDTLPRETVDLPFGVSEVIAAIQRIPK